MKIQGAGALSKMAFHLLPAAAIFDMDGVLVNSNPFHVKKWIELLEERNIPFDPEDVPRQILGKRNDDAFRIYFGPSMNALEMRQLGADLEARFREAFRPYAKPLPGLVSLLDEIRAEGIPAAVASSAISANVEFVVDVLELRPYFRTLITGDDVRRPKPDPEIYLKAAEELGVDPLGCVGFEDSPVGIEAVKRAGMKCIAIASAFPLDELRHKTQADRAVQGFEELSLEMVRGLFSPARTPARGTG